MIRKIIYIFICVIVVFLAVVLFIFSSNKPGTNTPSSLTPTPVELDLGGVKTDNFLKQPIQQTVQGDALIVKTADYQIAYLKQFNEFVISLSTSSAQVRQEAEAAFLEKLNIAPIEACKLNVSVSAPFVSAEQSANKRLSFC